MLRTVLTIGVAAVAALAGCGGGEDAGSDAADTRPQADAAWTDTTTEPDSAAPTDTASVADTAAISDSGSGSDSAEDAGEASDAADGSALDVAIEDSLDASPEVDGQADADAVDAGPTAVTRIVIAGDSWSTGSVNPTLAALADAGFGAVAVTWEATAIAGSQAEEWIANQDGKLDALDAALDAEPPAGVLLLYLGGNDFNFAMSDQGWSAAKRDAAIDQVEEDLRALVDHALAGRPQLTAVLVDYAYFNYLKMRVVYGFDLAPSLHSFNEAYVEMGRRKYQIAQATPRCEYAHNFGILQHTYGDEQRVYPFEPYVIPAYEPGFFAAPGQGPDYQPYPGGNTAFPAPDPVHFDGLHPEDWAFRTILDNVLEQGLASLLTGQGWAPSSP